jgi:serine/threonine-protein kinase PpkA
VSAIVAGANDVMKGDARDLYGAVLDAAGKAVRDPNELSLNREGKLLSDMGLVGEYLEGLPYRSRVMTLSQEGWDAMSPSGQREFVFDLEAKLSTYEALDAEQGGGWFRRGDEADWLCRLLLEDLP